MATRAAIAEEVDLARKPQKHWFLKSLGYTRPPRQIARRQGESHAGQLALPTMEEEEQDRVAGRSPFHAECLKVIQKLREAPDRTLSHSVLLKRMKTDARAFQEIITTLEQRGDVLISTSSTAGRPSRCYQLLDGTGDPHGMRVNK